MHARALLDEAERWAVHGVLENEKNVPETWQLADLRKQLIQSAASVQDLTVQVFIVYGCPCRIVLVSKRILCVDPKGRIS